MNIKFTGMKMLDCQCTKHRMIKMRQKFVESTKLFNTLSEDFLIRVKGNVAIIQVITCLKKNGKDLNRESK